jgi:hypothetical protein
VLESKEIHESLRETRSKCLKTHGYPNDGYISFHCRVTGGIHNGQMCRENGDSPMVNRTYLRKAILGYDNPTVRPLNKTLHALRSGEMTMVIVGDSVTSQLSKAMNCEAVREGIKKYDWAEHLALVNYYSINNSLAAMQDFPIALLKYRHTDTEDMKEKIVRMYSEQLVVKKGVVIVLNIGLHYHEARLDTMNSNRTRDRYQKDLQLLFSAIDGITREYPTKVFAVLWVETSAQHWSNELNGYYNGTTDTKCKPLVDRSLEADWRNRDVGVVLRESRHLFNGANVIFQIIPFRRITEDMWDSHVRGNYVDCTHCKISILSLTVLYF